MMSKNGTLSKVFVFTVGAAIGSAVTWKLLKAKYEQLAQEEIESVKEAFSNMPKYEGPENSEEEVAFSDKDKEEYAELVGEAGYVNYSDTTTTVKEIDDVEKPYVIAPDEFGDCDYRTISLTYYEDKVLADDMDNIIDDVDDVVGLSSLDTFGQYEDDTVFVRNDRCRCDYEICLDSRTYSDVTGISPHQMED